MPNPNVPEGYEILLKAVHLVAADVDLGEPPSGPISRTVPKDAHVADRALLSEPRVQQYRAALAAGTQSPIEAQATVLAELRPRLHERVAEVAGLPKAAVAALAQASSGEFSDASLRQRAAVIDLEERMKGNDDVPTSQAEFPKPAATAMTSPPDDDDHDDVGHDDVDTDADDADIDEEVHVLDECEGAGEFRDLPVLVGPRLTNVVALRTAGQLAYLVSAGVFVFRTMDLVASRAMKGRLDLSLDLTEDGYALDGLVCWDGQGTAYQQEMTAMSGRLLGSGPGGDRQLRRLWGALLAALHEWLCEGVDTDCQRARVELAADAFKERVAASVHTLDAPLVQKFGRRYLVGVRILRRIGGGSVWGAVERYLPGDLGWEAEARRTLLRATAVKRIFRALEDDDVLSRRAELARAVAVLDATKDRGGTGAAVA